jgi:Flp pilus assembly protein TadD
LLKSLFRRWRPRRREPPGEASRAIALQLLGEGRLGEAEALLREACARQPGDAEAWHLLGHLLTVRGEARGAVDALERAVALAPDNVEALYNLAMAHAAAGDRQAALDVLERVTSIKPRWFAPWLALGNLHAERDRVDEAEDVYRRALEFVPDAADVHYNLGNLLLRCGLADEAAARYRHAVTLQPSFARAYSNLLCALNYSGTENPERIRDAHVEFGTRYADALAGPRPEGRGRATHARIRIGYVSPDFRTHAATGVANTPPTGATSSPRTTRRSRK